MQKSIRAASEATGLLSNPQLASHLVSASAAEAPDLRAYVEQGAALVDRALGHALRDQMPLVWDKAQETRERGHSELATQIEIVGGLFEKLFMRRNSLSTDEEQALGECAFALIYTVAGNDMIPDGVEPAGMVDDAAVLQTVAERNDALVRAFCAEMSCTWPEVPITAHPPVNEESTLM